MLARGRSASGPAGVTVGEYDEHDASEEVTQTDQQVRDALRGPPGSSRAGAPVSTGRCAPPAPREGAVRGPMRQEPAP
ncbi:MAG: hypothetical protein AVDCRST_MAG77-2408 [uncultured Chloroflexi bacterium]|uniref:Uncharacterized protein n=1 Tax=uncultured Chloroflexota bacterium TaxID=166587 RepID=A0A6J4INS8_9CHLR|nr:MAG: hypothetical protein AVDCRST_MAG77-2408 [uncultured Chloroflexota bacterium]